MKTSRLLLGLALSAALAVPSAAFGAANIYIVNADGPNEGFNDPTPVAPVGGNPGTTLGQQRLNAFQFAADIWGSILDSDADIYILSSFDPLPCSATGGTLGAAGALEVWANTPGVEVPGVWYHVALANKLAGGDLSPDPFGEDLIAFFNTDLDNPVCLGARGWYYGLDNKSGDDIDLVVVNLYPFEDALARGAGPDELVETIDIGGPALIRAAAKNHASVTVIADPADYAPVIEEMEAGGGATTLETRRALAARAFARTAAYDSAVSGWLLDATGTAEPAWRALGGQLRQRLRYGENPHQDAAFYASAGVPEGLAAARQVQGKALSYNNINDTDAALECVAEFAEPAVLGGLSGAGLLGIKQIIAAWKKSSGQPDDDDRR